MEDCVFCKIVGKEMPSDVIYEDEKCVVIPDKFPAVNGQGLVIVKEHVGYFGDLNDDVVAHVFKVAKKIAKAMDEAFGAIRTCVFVEGFEVDHVHIKLYPVLEKRLDLRNAKEVSGEDMKEVTEKIRSFLK